MLGEPGGVTGDAGEGGDQALDQECLILQPVGQRGEHVGDVVRVVQCRRDVFH